MSEQICSPLRGKSIPIEQVEDPVFAEKMLGDGMAIRPELKVESIVAPCDGVIQTLHSSHHAVAIGSYSGVEVLIHVGIDTVTLAGKGFKAFVQVGDKVKKGDKLLEVDFRVIVDSVPSIDIMVITTNLTSKQSLKKSTKDIVIAGEELFVIVDESSEMNVAQSNTNSNESVSSDIITIINKTGIHARPASVIFNLANKFKSKIELKKNDKVINAKSIIAILGLGAKYQDKIQVIATGEDALSAVKAIQQAVAEGLGESDGGHNTPVENKIIEQPSSDTVKSYDNYDFSKEVTLKGVLASPGLVIGKVVHVSEEEIEVLENASDKQAEENLLDSSIVVIKNTLIKEINKAKEQKKTTQVEVYQAHLTILNDPTILEQAKKLINNGKTAAFAWRGAINQSVEVLKSTNDKLLMERVADLKDIEKRVLKVILKIDTQVVSYAENSIVLAKDLVPSDISHFNNNVKGVILALGSSTSHVALILRNMGVPTLVAVGEFIIKINDGTQVVVDATEEKLIVNPASEKLTEIISKQTANEKIKLENTTNAKKPAVTLDGTRVVVKGNVSNAKETKSAYDLGGEGVGLLRTEFLFFNSTSEPTEEEQNAVYQNSIDAMQGESVTLRTLDVGGDKPLAYVNIGEEENPIIGLRGVRNYFSNMPVFLRQIRAILKIKPVMLCKIMIPMISEVSEFIEVKKLIQEEQDKLGIKDKLSIGTMIEVPSSALIADKMAKYADFLSIGTNDLTQYTLAMDRGNPNLTSRLINLNPAVLKLIKMTVDGGNKYGKPVAVCGAMASEVKSIPILLGLGVKELSTSMKSIPDVKALIRSLNHKQCIEVANKALELESSEEVMQLVNNSFFN